MRMMTGIAAIALAMTGTAAVAQHVTVAVTGGTLSVGPELGYRVNDRFGVRANATFLTINQGFDSDDIEYDGRVKLKSAGAMLDLYPFGGSFRISGGARVNGNNGRVVATPTGPVEIGDRTYTPAQVGTLTGRAETKNLAPALTLGWGGGNRTGFNFGFEAGALFQGKVRIPEFSSSSGLINPADLAAERQSIQDDVDDYKVYPILQLAIGYRF